MKLKFAEDFKAWEAAVKEVDQQRTEVQNALNKANQDVKRTEGELKDALCRVDEAHLRVGVYNESVMKVNEGMRLATMTSKLSDVMMAMYSDQLKTAVEETGLLPAPAPVAAPTPPPPPTVAPAPPPPPPTKPQEAPKNNPQEPPKKHEQAATTGYDTLAVFRAPPQHIWPGPVGKPRPSEFPMRPCSEVGCKCGGRFVWARRAPKDVSDTDWRMVHKCGCCGAYTQVQYSSTSVVLLDRNFKGLGLPGTDYRVRASRWKNAQTLSQPGQAGYEIQYPTASGYKTTMRSVRVHHDTCDNFQKRHGDAWRPNEASDSGICDTDSGSETDLGGNSNDRYIEPARRTKSARATKKAQNNKRVRSSTTPLTLT